MENKTPIYDYIGTLASNNDSMAHAGIKGMRWGVRRFQNEDGTLTEEGKLRYNRDTSGLSDAKKRQYKANPEKWVNEDLDSTKRILDGGSDAMRKMKEANDADMRSKQKAKLDLSNMSDKELRDAINRYNLEQQYTNAFAPSTVSKGQEITSKIMGGIGTALGMAGSAVTIALGIRALMGKG